MSTIDDGGPAFPAEVEGYSVDQVEANRFLVTGQFKGMSLRDWFAGQETLSDYDHPDSWDAYNVALEAVNGTPPNGADNPVGYLKWECDARAKLKLRRADAMIAARKGGASE